MFLRRRSKVVRGERYEYWSLCEAVRTAKGPRQREVASLGKLGDAAPGEQAGWEDLDELLAGRPRARRPQQLPLPLAAEAAPAAATPTTPRWERADLARLRVERVRDFGAPYLALSLWRRLGLDELLNKLIEPGREEISWERICCLLTVARFCAQPSELGIAEHWLTSTALDDLLGVDAAQCNDDRLYRALDVLGAHKQALCKHLLERYQSWFGTHFEFLIYDVTSTFFEGQCEDNKLAQRGYSRDQRSDCKQVCIALVVTPEGLPLSFELFAGNRVDVSTVEDVVRAMEEKYGQSQRVWVMDRGMVSEKNIAFLRSRQARYLVGTPKSQLRRFEAQLLEKEGWSQVQEGLEARLLAHPDGRGEEQFVLCRSSARTAKETAMLQRQMEALCKQLAAHDRSLQRKPQVDLEQVGRRLGRWLGKYPAAAKLLHVQVEQNAAGAACGVSASSPYERGKAATQAHGAYLLRTNCTEKDPAQLWRWYVQLTQAEAAFRTAKSDLGLRPIYHQKTARVEAHILVCFLALALWRVLEQWMQGKQLGTCARQLVREIGTVRSLDVVVPVRREEDEVEVRLRVVAKPERRVAELLTALGLQLPAGQRRYEM